MKKNQLVPATGSIVCGLAGLLALGTASFGQTPAQWVNAHNAHRRALISYDGKPTSSPDLVWSDALAKDAQEWATKSAASGKGEHRPKTGADSRPWGENLAWSSSTTYDGLNGVTQWADEKPFFVPKTSKCTPNNECGHFTQLVSQLSREVGCATAVKSDEPNAGTYVVCNYSPHGNRQENGAYEELYKDQRPPVPGGAVFANLNTTMRLNLVFNQCLLDLATGLLAAAPPATAGTPSTVAAACNYTTIRSYDTGVGASGKFTPESAGGQLINLYFNNQILGLNGAVVVSLNPARAVLLTGE